MEKVFWWRTSVGLEETNRVADSIRKELISQGPVTTEFERELAKALNVPFVVATTSGSMALLMALMANDIGPGDEVIVPNQTFIATAHAVLMAGASVVLADTRDDIPILDTASLEAKITSRTKAIIPVHLNGRAVDLPGIFRLADRHKLVVVEDTAQGAFSKGPDGCFLGTRSDCGCFSLGATKLFTTGQGGFVVTQREDLFERLKLIRTHGISDLMNETYNCPGFNFKFNDILASVGLEQMQRVPSRIGHLNMLYDKYRVGLEPLSAVKLVPVNVPAGELPLYIDVLCDDREDLLSFLRKNNIEARRFHPALNRAAYLQNGEDLPNANAFAQKGIVLPCGPAQPLENVDRVLEALSRYA